MPSRPCAIGTPRSPSTCRAPTAATPNGRRPEMMSEAAKVGPATVALFEAIMKAKPHPEQGFRSCLGIMRARQKLRRCAPRSRVPARQRHRRDQLRLDRVDPQAWARQSLCNANRRRTPRRSGTATSVVAATSTDEREAVATLRANANRKGDDNAHASNRTTADRARPRRHGKGARRATTSSRTSPHSPSRSGSRCMVDREAIERENKRLVSRLKFAGLRQNAVVEDIDMKAPRGLDKPLFAKLAAGDWIDRHQNLIDHRPDRRRQKLARLCARPQGLPRRSLGALSSRATAVRCARAGTRRRPPCSAAQEPRPRRTADPRRLGARHSDARSGARPPGDRRRSPRTAARPS